MTAPGKLHRDKERPELAAQRLRNPSPKQPSAEIADSAATAYSLRTASPGERIVGPDDKEVQ
jgi:hypothetical protein